MCWLNGAEIMHWEVESARLYSLPIVDKGSQTVEIVTP